MEKTTGWAEDLETLIRFHTASMDGQHRPKLIVATKSFVENLLATQKKEIREKVQGMRKVHRRVPLVEERDQNEAYEIALDDALALLDES